MLQEHAQTQLAIYVRFKRQSCVKNDTQTFNLIQQRNRTLIYYFYCCSILEYYLKNNFFKFNQNFLNLQQEQRRETLKKVSKTGEVGFCRQNNENEFRIS